MKYGKTEILVGDACEQLRTLDAGSVHCVVTSPPYWGLRDYGTGDWTGGDPECDHDQRRRENDSTSKESGYGGQSRDSLAGRRICRKCGATRTDGQIGLEDSIEEHMAALVEVFREVRRVLRDDGQCWVNYGFKREGHLLLLPFILSDALEADGWTLVDAVIWAKGVSHCPTYSGSVMPESLSGTRWERCRVKVSSAKVKFGGAEATAAAMNRGGVGLACDGDPDRQAEWSPCPGCPKCELHGGYVLLRGSWRCTSSYEVLLQLVKQPGYFSDQEAVRERWSDARQGESGNKCDWSHDNGMGHRAAGGKPSVSGRNPRSVWTIPSQAVRLRRDLDDETREWVVSQLVKRGIL